MKAARLVILLMLFFQSDAVALTRLLASGKSLNEILPEIQTIRVQNRVYGRGPDGIFRTTNGRRSFQIKCNRHSITITYVKREKLRVLRLSFSQDWKSFNWECGSFKGRGHIEKIEGDREFWVIKIRFLFIPITKNPVFSYTPDGRLAAVEY